MKDQVHAVVLAHLAEFAAAHGVEITPEMVDLPQPPDASMGDYALNLPLRLAKPLRRSPLQIAGEIAELLRSDTAWFAQVTVAPPGYVNLFLADTAVATMTDALHRDADLLLRKGGTPETVVVDYSGVNIAKQMHVGHLRSTIIGDVIARVLEARGERVIRQNHLGDWGVPIAMVLWKAGPILRDDPESLTLAKLEDLYREATAACKADPAIYDTCQQMLIQLQNGDAQLLAEWRAITRISMNEVYRVYRELGVSLAEEHERGESFYRDLLADTVRDIDARGKLTESQGAQCVFLEQFKGKDGQPLPVIVRKTDGGFNYETFDLAAIRYRTETLQANRVIYVTDARQALHFAQVFAVADACGWTEHAKLEHVAFGSVLGEDNKPLKTRSGESVKLADLLAEATERALAVVQEKNAELPASQQREVAAAVGIGAIKYADLSHDRNNDYVFAWERMLALTGNTAPYLQYAHARICSIFRRGNVEEEAQEGPLQITHPAERALALKLLALPEVVAAVEIDLRPHALCTYLYDLASAFSGFYDQCPVLTAETDEIRATRLFLCRLTQRVIARGLDLLGIAAPREM